MADIFLPGKKISLRVLTEADLGGPSAGWLNDPEICRYNSHTRFPVNQTELKRYLQTAKKSSNLQVLAIVTNRGKKHIGNISLQSINFVDRSAEIAIIIGDKNYWRKGIGFEAWSLAIRYGFERLNLHRLYCGTSAANVAMQRLADKLGMKKEGRRREALYKDGKYYDIIEYGLLKKEYEK